MVPRHPILDGPQRGLGLGRTTASKPALGGPLGEQGGHPGEQGGPPGELEGPPGELEGVRHENVSFSKTPSI